MADETAALKRSLEEQKQINERDRQALRDSQALAAELQRQLVEVQRQARLAQEPRVFHPYTWQTTFIYEQLSRLIPAAPADAPEPTSSNHETQEKSKTSNSTGSSSKSTTTAGQTSIHGKVYPLQVRPWEGFEELHKNGFARLVARLADRRVFPSKMQVRSDENNLIDDLPQQFLNTEDFLNESRTSVFLATALERPASKIMVQYFAADGKNKAVFFDNRTVGVKKVVPASSTPAQESAHTNTTTSSPVYSEHADSTTEVASDPDQQSAPPATTSPSRSGRKRVMRKTQPDCIVISKDMDDEEIARGAGARRILVGEHKPCHAMLPPELAAAGALTPDCLVRLALAFRVKDQKKRQKKDKVLPASFTIAGADSTTASGTRSTKRPKKGKEKETSEYTDVLPRLQTYFASALAQTYHYMISSGLEYGYLSSGATLTLLRIPEDESTTLLYHTLSFPAAPPEDLPKKDGRPQYPVDVTADTPPIDDAALSASALASLCSLCLAAFDSPQRSVTWTTKALRKLAAFPALPKSLQHRSSGSLPQSAVRRHDDEDGPGGDGSGSGSPPGDGDTERGRRGSQLARLRSSEQQQRAPSPLRQVHDVAGSTRSRPGYAYSYCTQKCLRGLAFGLPLDAGCPNYTLHRSAHGKTSSGDNSGNIRRGRALHPIAPAALPGLVCAQLCRAPEENCECLYDKGGRGAIGCLLKITLTGFGYTFVAKAVERENAYRLRHEGRLYAALKPCQGFTVPVCLGVTKLLVPYPLMARFTILTHVLFMSHTGVSLQWSTMATLSQRVGKSLDDELGRTYDELRQWGVEDSDEKMCNATWCEETQRVMKIDFDHAHLDRVVYMEKKMSDVPRGRKRQRDDNDATEEASKAVEATGAAEKRARLDVDDVTNGVKA